MTPRHALDGNARAADANYGQDRPEDYAECAVCGYCFDEVEQHPVMFNLCQDCAPDDDIGWIE